MLAALELRVPPPLLTLLTAIMMWLGARNSPPMFKPGWVRPTSLVLAAGGLLLIVTTIATLRRARTTVSPTRPDRTKALVTDGVFRLSRNPIYLGGALILAAFALTLWQPQSFVAVPVWGAWIQRFQITPEERMLRAQFGQAFNDYTQRVRRWV
jgi:protein-S-isoprenylcysteine O-methyltransferase Ste14